MMRMKVLPKWLMRVVMVLRLMSNPACAPYCRMKWMITCFYQLRQGEVPVESSSAIAWTGSAWCEWCNRLRHADRALSDDNPMALNRKHAERLLHNSTAQEASIAEPSPTEECFLRWSDCAIRLVANDVPHVQEYYAGCGRGLSTIISTSYFVF